MNSSQPLNSQNPNTTLPPAVQPPAPSQIGQNAGATQSSSMKTKPDWKKILVTLVCFASFFSTFTSSIIVTFYFSSNIYTIITLIIGSTLTVLIIALFQTGNKISAILPASMCILTINTYIFIVLYFSNFDFTISVVLLGYTSAGVIVGLAGKNNFGTQFASVKKELEKHEHTITILLFFSFTATIIFLTVSNSNNTLSTIFVSIVGILGIGSFFNKFQGIVYGLIAPVWLVVNIFFKAIQHYWNTISISLIVGFLVFNQVPYVKDNMGSFCLNHTGWQSVCGNGLTTMSIFATDPYKPYHGSYVTIGITDGSNPYVFDGSRTNVEEADVITKIGNENNKAMEFTHMDLVIVTILSRTLDDSNASVSVGIEDLRGAYLEIKNYNDKKTNKVKIRLLVANIGTQETTDTTVPIVMDHILRLSQQDSQLRGIIGLPVSAATSKAINGNWKIYGSNIPIVSPSATSNDFSNIPLFYRISSSDTMQVCSMMEEIVNELEPAYKRIDPNNNSDSHGKPQFNIALFYDENDSYSFSLEKSFQGILGGDLRYPCSGPGNTDIHFIPESITLNDQQTYSSRIMDAVSQKPDMIFFAGYRHNLNDFETQLSNEQAKQDQTYHIPIVGGDGLFDIARTITNSYSMVYSTVYASPVNHGSTDSLNKLLSDYSKVFNYLQAQNVTPLLPPHAILSYDATTAFASILDKSHQLPTQDKFNDDLKIVNFQGASGWVQFEGNSGSTRSDPHYKTVYIMCEDKNFQLQEVAEYIPKQDPSNYLKDVLNCK